MNQRLAALARFGGKPVRATPMPPRLALGAAELAMVDEVFRHYEERQIDPGYQGHFERLYCDAFVAAMGGGYADAVSTGTAAIYVAVAALGLPPGSEVIVSPITDPGSVNALIHAGLKIRLADSKPDSFNIGVEQFVDRIGPNTRAVLVVHAAGQAAEIDQIVAEAHCRRIKVIEDCSQAHMARLRGQPVGTFGDIAAFSTMYRKASITGAAGGVVYTRDLDLHRNALAHADRGKTPWIEGFDDKDPDQFLFPALNHHTDEISCAIGVASWQRLPETIAARMAFVRGLDALAQRSNACRPYGWSEGDSPFYYPIVVDPAALPVSKTEFALSVAAEGIGLNPHYKYLVADWRYLRPHLADGFETANARSIRDRCFTLFLNEKYGAQEVEDTIAAIAKVENALLA
ncbi:MAG: hypothetical protein JWO51_4225 [Rhodospirillales bacterium]|nr:hypothetical protein [Rhodospirillales bacterium]